MGHSRHYARPHVGKNRDSGHGGVLPGHDVLQNRGPALLPADLSPSLFPLDCLHHDRYCGRLQYLLNAPSHLRLPSYCEELGRDYHHGLLYQPAGRLPG